MLNQLGPFNIKRVVGAIVVGALVVGAIVVGAIVVGGLVVGALVESYIKAVSTPPTGFSSSWLHTIQPALSTCHSVQNATV